MKINAIEKIKLFYIKNSKIIKLFLINKSLIFVAAVIAILFFTQCPWANRSSDNIFINGWAQGDGKAYLWIAQYGYETDPAIWRDMTLNNFLPLYPILVRIIGMIFFNNFALGGFLVSNLFSFIFVFYLYKLLQIDFKKKISYRAVAFVLFFPTAFFFSAIYTESLFLALVVMSFYYARKGEWLKSSVIGMLLPITRIIGLFFFIPLFIEYMKQRDFHISKIDNKIFYFAFLFTGIALYFLFSFILNGTILGYQDKNNTWGFELAPPHVAIVNEIRDINLASISSIIYHSWNLFEIVLFSFLIIYCVYKKINSSYVIYMIIGFLLPLISSRLLGFSRYLIILFPAFLALSLLSFNKKYGKLIILMYILFAAMIIFLTARFVLFIPGDMINCIQ